MKTALQQAIKEIAELWSSPSDQPTYTQIFNILESKLPIEKQQIAIANSSRCYFYSCEETKEQIKELHHSGDVSKLKEWFPSVFGEELEVGVWYKNLTHEGSLFFNDGVKGNISYCGYGFDYNKNWHEHNKLGNWSFSNKYIKATKQEIETALINEAKKRGFKKGVYIEKLLGINVDTSNDKCAKNEVESNDFYLLMNQLFCGNLMLFSDEGAWATIIKPKQMTQEEIEKELGYKIEIV